jgi:hypothetical protein
MNLKTRKNVKEKIKILKNKNQFIMIKFNKEIRANNRSLINQIPNKNFY